MSLSDRILPPEIDFKIFVVAAPIFGYLVLALTAIPIYGLAIFNAGFRNLFQAVCVPLIFLFQFTFYRTTFELNLFRSESNLFLTFTLRITAHIVCFDNIIIFVKSHQAEILIADRCPCVHLALLIKSSPLVIYLAKICDLLRLQLLQLPLVILTSSLVLGFAFSNTMD